jgi:hypothetical protein
MDFSKQSASRLILFRLFRNPLNHWGEMDSEENKVGKAKRQRTACQTDLKQSIRLSFFWENLIGEFSTSRPKLRVVTYQIDRNISYTNFCTRWHSVGA